MSNAKPKTDTADEPTLRLLDESGIDNEDNINNVGDFVGKIELIQEPEQEPEAPVDDKKAKVKKVKEADADWGFECNLSLEEIKRDYGSFDAYVKERSEYGYEVRMAGDVVREKRKSLDAMGAAFKEKCKKEVAPVIKEFQDALINPDVVASVQFAKDIFTGNSNVYNGLGVAFKLGILIGRLDAYQQEIFFLELRAACKVHVKYSKPIRENPFLGVINVLYFDVDPSLKSKYTSILTYASNLDMNPDLFADWLGTNVFTWNDNDGTRCTGTGYTSCLKEISYNRKIDKGEIKPEKVTNEIPAWCFAKTNASISMDIPDFWDAAKQKEGMALFRIEDGKLRLYNVTTNKPSTIVKIVRENYGSADDTSYDGTQSELTQFMIAVKKIIEISNPNAIMIAQYMEHEYKHKDTGEIFHGPGNFYVAPLYGCYQDDVTPRRLPKKGENWNVSPLVVIPSNSPNGEIPEFPEYSAVFTADRMASDDYEEERGILQRAYYTTDIKNLIEWDQSFQPEMKFRGTSGSQFWFMDALFRHMDHTSDYMPHPHLNTNFSQRPKIAKLGHRLRFDPGANAMDKYFAETKKILGDGIGKTVFERHTRWTHIVVENGELAFWWPAVSGYEKVTEERRIKFGTTAMTEVKAVWLVPTASLKHLFKIGGEWRIILDEDQYSALTKQYEKEGNWPDSIWKRPLASYFGVAFVCQRKYLFININGRVDRCDM